MRNFHYLIVSLLILFTSNPAWSSELKSNVIILIDYSNSYYYDARMKKIEKNISKVATAIAKSKTGAKKPALIQVLPINSMSQTGEPICEFLLLRKGIGTLGGKGDCGGLPKGNCSSKKKNFEDYMETSCKKVALEMPMSEATDISGAVSLASQMGASQTDNTKYLIFFSDMFEYRDSTIPVTAANLQNFKVLVVCSSEIYSSSSGDSEFCMSTESKWKQEFSKLGAKEVLFVLETGDWQRKLTKGFFKP